MRVPCGFTLSCMSNARPDVFKAAMAVFGLGLLAVVVVYGLFAAGHENLPLWLNLATSLAPLGLITGLITLVVRTRRQARRGTR